MSEAIPIYQGQDFYVPYFEVRVDKQPLKKDVVRDVMQVSYKDSIADIDQCQLTINNWDAEGRAFKYTDMLLFTPGQEFELWMGYYGQDSLRLMLKGEITSMRPTFPASGPPTLAVEALNLLHRFRRKQESHTYEKMKDSAIAREIGQSRLGVCVCTNDEAEAAEEEYEYLIQDNQLDIIFLIERARRIGYDLFVKERGENGRAGESQLHFIPSKNVRDVTYKLVYGSSLVQFASNLTTAHQVAKVTVVGWDNVAKKEIRYTAERDEISTRGVDAKGNQAEIDASYRDREEIIADQPVNSMNEAKTLARETLEKIAKEMLKGTGTTVGLPDLRAGRVIELEGLGKRFSGRYFVTSTTHTIGDSGYTTQFECRREEI